ncbi:MAG TPA: VOC family protein [Devosiaceae bacterium]|jgi:hypothetical protein
MSDINTLHHIGLIGHDLSLLSLAYERLGFTLTPVSLPRIPLEPDGAPQPLGAGNRCAIFAGNYLELLGVVDAARWQSITVGQRGAFDLDAPLRRYEGLHVLHLGTQDIEAVRARLLGAGLQPSPIHPFQRPVDTPDGPQIMRAKTMSFAAGTMPEALFQIAQHETPELVLQPRHMTHRNGARGINDIILCVEDAVAVADRYALVAGKPVTREGKVLMIDLGLARMLVTDRQSLGQLLPTAVAPVLPFLAGFSVAADIEMARRHFGESGIIYEDHGASLIVGPGQCGGTSIRFEEATR